MDDRISGDLPSAIAARSVNVATLAAIAIIVGLISNQLHEAVGHGGTCLATGHHVSAWGAFYVDCNLEGAPRLDARLVAMAGSTVNLIAALIGAALFRAADPARGTHRFFLWLFATVNAFEWAGYFLFSGVSGIGDWGTDGVLAGTAQPWPWRILFAVGGMALYVWLAQIAMRTLAGMTGAHPAGLKQAHRIATICYFTIGIASTLVGLLNPMGIVIVLSSAMASSFGGLSGLLWAQSMLRPGAARGPLIIRRSLPLMIAALALLLAVAAVLGPTLNFAAPAAH